MVVLLLLTLALTGVMAWQAQSAAHRHRDAAEGALRDYAGFAAFLFRQAGRSSLFRTIANKVYVFEAVQPPASGPLPSVAAIVSDALPSPCPTCPPLDSVRGWFRVDLRDGSVETTSALPADVSAWLADTARALTGDGQRMDPSLETALVLTRAGGVDRAFAWLVRRDPTGRAAAVYGFETSPRALATAAFAPVAASQTVLPPTLTRGQPTDSLISLAIVDPSGRELYATPRRWAGTVATDTLGVLAGGLAVRVTLRESAAERLLIGGMPKARLPFLLALLALAVGLTAVALAQLRRERELARLRADFVSGVSHELRTPLAQIRMFAETLRLGRVRSDAEQRRSLDIIDQEARRLSALVDNVLLFSRAERRAVTLDRQPAELAPLVRDAVETFAPLAAARRVTIDERLAEGVEASVDRGAFRQMLLNLLDNAVKYGPPGQSVEVGLERAGGEARVWVRDAGPGIPPRDRERIFAPFVRLPRDAESAVAGSGIGLAVVARLAAQHGGRARAEDAPGGGARFVIELPAIAPTEGV